LNSTKESHYNGTKEKNIRFEINKNEHPYHFGSHGILINKIQQPTHAKGCMHKIMNWRCTLNEDLNDCLF
jgi:hypothetical protein